MKTTRFLTAFAVVALLTNSVFAQKVEIEDETNFKRRSIKFEVFSPLTGNTTLGYEQYVKDWISIEGKIGLIGLGIQPDKSVHDKGFFVSVGPKFKLKPTYAISGTHGTNRLGGSYFRPDITVGTFEVGSTGESLDDVTGRNNGDNIVSVALMLNYGKQYILGDILTLDWYFGMGYAYVSDNDGGYYYKYAAGGNDFPIAFNAGLTLGLLLK